MGRFGPPVPLSYQISSASHYRQQCSRCTACLDQRLSAEPHPILTLYSSGWRAEESRVCGCVRRRSRREEKNKAKEKREKRKEERRGGGPGY